MSEETHAWKYSECPTTEVSVRLSATADAVWALVSDISLPTRWSTEVQATAWLDGATGPSPGARFGGHNRHAAIGEWDVECTVTQFVPNRCFEWSIGDPSHPSSIWRFIIDDDGDDGSVVLRQEFQMGPAPSGLNMAIDAMPDKESRIISRRLAEHRQNMQANLDGIRELLKSGAR